MDVALVTCATLAQLNPFDIPLLEALRTRGLSAQPLVWNDTKEVLQHSNPCVPIYMNRNSLAPQQMG
jgi:hypothetical protein